MAPPREEIDGLRDENLCRLLQLITEQRGEWKNKTAQDNAIIAYLQTNPLYRYEQPAMNARKILHDAESVRRMLTQAVSGNGRKPGRGQRKPGIQQVFAEGATAFDAGFLLSIGWEDWKNEENDPSIDENFSEDGIASVHEGKQKQLGTEASSSANGVRKRSPKRKADSDGSDAEDAGPSLLEEPPQKKTKRGVKNPGRLAAVEETSPLTFEEPDVASRCMPMEPDGDAEDASKRDIPPVNDAGALSGTTVDQPKLLRKRVAEALKTGDSAVPGLPEAVTEMHPNKKRKVGPADAARDSDGTQDKEVAAKGFDVASGGTSNQSDSVAPAPHPEGKATSMSASKIPPDQTSPDQENLHLPRTSLTQKPTASKSTTMNADAAENADQQAALHAEAVAAAIDPEEVAKGPNSTPTSNNATEAAQGLLVNGRPSSMPSLRQAAGSGAPINLNVPPSEVPLAHKPADPVDMMWGIMCERIEFNNSCVWGNIEQAEACYTRANNVNHAANTLFVSDPSRELEELYKTMFGTEDWRARALELQSREQPFQLWQCDAIRGLISAAVYSKIYKARLPWDIGDRLKESLGTDVQYVDNVMHMRGHPYEMMLKHASWKQIVDVEFQETVVKPYAHDLAQQVAMTLLPQFRLFAKHPNPKPYQESKWLECMELAFKQAIVFKQKLESSEKGTFEFVWLKGDEDFQRSRHMSDYEWSTGNVCVTIYPGVLTQRQNGPYFVERVRVIALDKSQAPAR
ncbi:hypothetical protein LTR85_006790 [Meristemomyces frigidus]|nr:hypothetical protein LTR85_006790 [Meristemomyces frigidus]